MEQTYLAHLNITIEGPRELSEYEVMNLLAQMITKLDNGTTLTVELAYFEAV